jgi:hypothetical protein
MINTSPFFRISLVHEQKHRGYFNITVDLWVRIGVNSVIRHDELPTNIAHQVSNALF